MPHIIKKWTVLLAQLLIVYTCTSASSSSLPTVSPIAWSPFAYSSRSNFSVNNYESNRKFDIIDLNKYPFNTYFNMAFYMLNVC